MKFQEVIDTRKTVRDFSDQKIDYSIVERAIRNAFKAPTYNHLREWYFIVIDDLNQKIKLTETEKMYSVVPDEIKKSFENYDHDAAHMYLNAIPKQKRMILSAPSVITVAYKPKTPITEAMRVYDLNCLASVWCCIENFLLSLSEDNVFGVTFIPKNTDRVKSILNIPSELEVAAILPIGYERAGAVKIKQKDIDISEHIHTNFW